MKKFTNPFKTAWLWISQTLHITAGNRAIDLGKAPAGTPVYAIAGGVIGAVSPTLGSYLTLKVDNSPLTLYYVHIYNFTVTAGQRVLAGDKLGVIAPKSANGGYSPHLHLGISPTSYNIMDYMDRGIDFKTEYPEIAEIWFNNKNGNDGLNWSLFKDLSYENKSNMSIKVGSVIIFTEKQNKRGGAGTGFADIGAYEKGELAIVKDGPRTSQNAQFYGKGSENKTNDKYTWFDTTPAKGGASSWVADMGKFRLATPEEISPPWAEPEPTPTPEPQVPPVIEPTPLSELAKCEERYKEAQEEIRGLTEALRASEKEVKRLRVEVEQKEAEYLELREKCDSLEEKNKMLEEERLLLQEHQEKELKAYRRWDWLIKFLNAIFPVK